MCYCELVDIILSIDFFIFSKAALKLCISLLSVMLEVFCKIKGISFEIDFILSSLFVIYAVRSLHLQLFSK